MKSGNRNARAGGRSATSTTDAHVVVTMMLEGYASRGVFRGFRATPASRGRVEYGFLWLTRKPMTATFDATRRRLSFPALFPGIDRSAAAALTAMVEARTSRQLPGHKRLDARRARMTGTVRKGDWSLWTEIRGGNHEYAVTKTLNLVNELFVMLHEHHPAYLIERFGLSAE